MGITLTAPQPQQDEQPAPPPAAPAPALAGGGTGGINDVLSQIVQLAPQLRAAQSPQAQAAQAAIGRNTDTITKLANEAPEPMPAKPVMKDLPQKPEYQFRDTMEAFQNPAMALVILGSLLTRNPLKAAIKSGAAAMQGFAKGDQAAYEKNRADWKDNLDAALAQNRQEIEKYREVLEERRTSATEKLARINGLAAANRDEQMLISSEQGLLNNVFTLVQHRDTQARLAQQAADTQTDRKERREETSRHNTVMEDIAGQNADTRANTQQGGRTEAERSRRTWFELDDKVANGTITPQEKREYDTLTQRLFPTKNFVTQDKITAVEPNIPTLQGAPPPSPAAAGAPGAAPGAPKVVQTPGGKVSQFSEPKLPPQPVEKGMIADVTSVNQIDDALKAIEANPKAVGWGPWIAGATDWTSKSWDRYDPAGVDARAKIADIGSLKIHDRSGAAVTASEFPRLRPFIPSVGDAPETVKDKLKHFRENYIDILREQYEVYGPKGGFKQQPSLERILGGGKAPAPSPAGAGRFDTMPATELGNVDPTTLSPEELEAWRKAARKAVGE